MRNIEPHIKEYINESIDKAEARFAIRIEGYMKDLSNGFEQKMMMGFEAIDLHIKETIREELRPMQNDIDNHNVCITKLELRRA